MDRPWSEYMNDDSKRQVHGAEGEDDFLVCHLASGEIFARPSIYVNRTLYKEPDYGLLPYYEESKIEGFHRTLPEYGETPLISVPELAEELQVGHVFVKDESSRFGLPAFKILGASWAIYRAVCEEVGQEPDVSLHQLGQLAQKREIGLVTCSDGNWGRSVARMGKHLGIPALVFVPQNIDKATQDKVAGEGAEVRVVEGSYDDSIAAARKEANETGALLVMDTSWPGYEQIPAWVQAGYSTMLREVDRQVKDACGLPVTTAIVAVGVGSWAQSVVRHFEAKGGDTRTKVITVEPQAAPSLYESLQNDKITPVVTGDTIMCGMCCGTVSSIAWPLLQKCVHASVVVSELEAHKSVQHLGSHGVNAGPCGAATLAAARKAKGALIKPDPNGVLVLFSTEGRRDYVVPT